MAEDLSALRPLGRSRLYEELVDRLAEYVVRSGLAPGERFPAERELASRLRVSRASIRQALAVLEAQGFIEVRHGEGIFLRRSAEFGEALHKLLERRSRLPEVLEARELLEVRLAELAAQRRTEADLEAMRAGLTRMEEEIAAGGIGVDGDADFHRAVHLAAKNRILGHVIGGLAESITETRLESLSEPARPSHSLAAHRLVLREVEAQRPAEAAEAMRSHLREVADVALLRWQPGSGDVVPIPEP